MDPNANLAEQASLLDAADRHDLTRRRELREALQEWLDRRGFAPDWKAYPAATKAFRTWQRNRIKFADLYR